MRNQDDPIVIDGEGRVETPAVQVDVTEGLFIVNPLTGTTTLLSKAYTGTISSSGAFVDPVLAERARLRTKLATLGLSHLSGPLGLD